VTTEANPLIFSVLLFGCACFGVAILWMMRRPPPLPRIPPFEPTELDNDQPPERKAGREPPFFINTIGKD
jgi:hypothetical protein